MKLLSLRPQRNILFTKYKTKVLNLSLNLDLSPFVKSAPEEFDNLILSEHVQIWSDNFITSF